MGNGNVGLFAHHDPRLVALSVFISILAAYAARNLSERVSEARGRDWLIWHVCGATVDGVGTWSMHFTGKLALRLPVPVLFDWPTLLLTFLVATIGSAAALLVVSRAKIGWLGALAASVFLGGVGISGLHFTAMAAIRMPGMHHYYYSPTLVVLSVVLAIVISLVALAVTFLFRDVKPGRGLRYHAGAVLRGAANPVVHNNAMAAVIFTYTQEVPNLSHAVGIKSRGILGISIVPVMVLVVALLTTLVDRLQKQSALLDELFEQAPQAVALLSVDEQVVRVNREFTRLFGYSTQEAVGRRLSDLIVPPELRDEAQRFADLGAQGQRVDAESVRQRKDGSCFQVSIIRVPITTPGGRVGIYAIYRDLIERERVEQAKRESADRLLNLSRRLLELQEVERRHLARELHDEVGQLLTGLRLLLSPNGGLAPEAARARFEQAVAIIDELMEKVRGLSFDLRPAALDQLGLLPALLALFERFAEQAGVQVHFKHHGLERGFAPEVETTVYRIVQESLTNVVRHAGVKEVTIRVWATPDLLSVQIEDCGRGFDPEAALAEPRSNDLAGMRERVMLLGGNLRVESRSGGGKQITAEIPLSKSGGE